MAKLPSYKISVDAQGKRRRVYDYKQRVKDASTAVGECWIWARSKTGAGYGQTSYKCKRIDAHRFSYVAFNGEIPRGMVVMHTCDVKLCVNPDHLRLGTTLDNMRDMHAKGRHRSRKTYIQQSGEKAWNASFTNEQANEVRRKYIPRKYGQRQLAKEYGVEKTTIANILKNRTYVNG